MPASIQQLLQFSGMDTNSASVLGMTLALVAATAAAWLAQLLYQFSYENRETGSQIHRSFLLIGPSVTLLFITVQLSLPLSLGLLGALSIVRFRVPIKEPEEIGFLMVVIAASIACATYNYGLLAILFAIVITVLCGRRLWSQRRLGHGRDGGLFLLTLRDDAYRRHTARPSKICSPHSSAACVWNTSPARTGAPA